MTDREPAAPRPDPPGPTPRLDAVERLRRQLEAADSRAAKRGSRSPRKPATPTLGPDLFGRDSADPYTRNSSSDLYGRSSANDRYSRDSGDLYGRDSADPNSANSGWTYSEPSEPYSPPDAPSAHTAYDATGFAKAGHNLTAPEPPDDTPEDPWAPPSEPAGSPRRSPTGRRRSPGQWREEASTAPGDGGKSSAPESTPPGSSTTTANSPRAPRNSAYRDIPRTSRPDHGAAEHGADSQTSASRTGRRAKAETRTDRGATGASSGPAGAAYRQAEEFLARITKGAAPQSDRDSDPGPVESGIATGTERDGRANRVAESFAELGMADRDDGADAAGMVAGGQRRGSADRRAGGTAPQADQGVDDDSEEGDRRGGRGGRRRGRGQRPESGAGARESGPAGGGTESQAKDVCLRLLTDRARSRAELADRLAEKGFAAGVAERVLDRLAEVGLIDDAAFAQQWVHSRHTYSGKGKKVLAQELRRKGIAPEDAEPALEAITAEDENARAADLVRRKLQSLSPDLSRDKAISRLVSMLARRGYAPTTAYSVVTAELSASGLDLPRETPRAAQPEKPSVPAKTDDDGEQEGEGSDEDSAAEFVRRKMRSLPPNLEREKAIRRLVGMLARRGYNQSLAYKVVKAELG
ncbi:recombination regulator RecX [Nocardia sp. NPDC020380]|uniref:recombination regulator RecX n=1 Tax=Nocardia sp. NPDC020380 TaxID=3364309 RepID=UPI0037959005